MRLQTLLPFLPLLSSTINAFVIPTDQPDGAYIVTFDLSGTPNITKLEDPITQRRRSLQPSLGSSPSAKFGTTPLRKRDSMGGTGRTFPNHADYNACTSAMKLYFDNGVTVAPHTIYYVSAGSAFLALCNYSPNRQGGYGWEVDNFNGLMDTYYGYWKTGWWHLDGPNKTFWRDLAGNDICTNG